MPVNRLVRQLYPQHRQVSGRSRSYGFVPRVDITTVPSCCTSEAIVIRENVSLLVRLARFAWRFAGSAAAADMERRGRTHGDKIGHKSA
jgi:hypothetical protein